MLERRSYAADVRGNLAAAIELRLGTLIKGTKGLILNTRSSTPPSEIFERPCVIQLANLGDDMDKAFLMSLLFALLYEHSEQRASRRPPHVRERLDHVTLIEEAHRLLRAPALGMPDAAARAVTMFTDMLAEMRAYGEGFLIAEQVPAKLTPDVLKNTGTKVIHRLSAWDDRYSVGQTIGLSEAQSNGLNSLEEGEALTLAPGASRAVKVKVDLLDLPPSHAVLPELPPDAKVWLKRDGACSMCASPCQHMGRVDAVFAQLRVTAESRNRRQIAPVPQRFDERRQQLMACLEFSSAGNSIRAAEELSKWITQTARLFPEVPPSTNLSASPVLMCSMAADIRAIGQMSADNQTGLPLPQRLIALDAAMAVIARGLTELSEDARGLDPAFAQACSQLLPSPPRNI
jgi:hypothetical protein